MNNSYRFEDLSDKIHVCVSAEHRFGTDAFLLASFAAPRKKDIVCDLGTGCGIIPLLFYRNFGPAKVVGVDIQPQAVEQFTRSVQASICADRLFPLEADLTEIARKKPFPLLPPHTFDLVTCNPPYKAANSGILSDQAADQIARHETLCTIDDVCAAAARLLKFGGRLCVCQRPERICDTIAAMRAHKIEPKRLRFVAKNLASAPWLFLLEGKKGSKPFLKVEPLLTVQGKEGFSEELLKIYGLS